jgi:hypothetical protein
MWPVLHSADAGAVALSDLLKNRSITQLVTADHKLWTKLLGDPAEQTERSLSWNILIRVDKDTDGFPSIGQEGYLFAYRTPVITEAGVTFEWRLSSRKNLLEKDKATFGP